MKCILFLYGFPMLKEEFSPMVERLREDHHVIEDPREADASSVYTVMAYSAGIIDLLDHCKADPLFKKRIEKIILIAPVGMRPTGVIRHSAIFLGEAFKTSNRLKIMRELFLEIARGSRTFYLKVKRIAHFDLIKETSDRLGMELRILGNSNDAILSGGSGVSDQELVLEHEGKGHFSPLELPDLYAGIIKTL